MKSLFTAATGMEAQQTRIAVISNNIANVNTTGFKSSRAEFQDLLYETRALAGTEASAGNQRPSNIQIGSGVSVVSTQSLFSQGTAEQTSRSLDVMIEGEGFFGVQLPSGETAYTRAGSLSMDSTGRIVTQSGFPLSPAVSVNTAGVDRSIGVDGTISSNVNGTTTQEGNIQIYLFANPAGLEQVGKNLYKETASSGTASSVQPGSTGAGTLLQGFLEGSNVNIAEELIRMIMAQRAYELNSKVIQSSDQMLAATSNIK